MFPRVESIHLDGWLMIPSGEEVCTLKQHTHSHKREAHASKAFSKERDKKCHFFPLKRE